MNESYKRYWEPSYLTAITLSLGTGALVTAITYPIEFVKRIIQFRAEGVGMRGTNVNELGTSANRIFRQMHETGGGLTQFYTGFQAHFYARMGYLFIRNTLYKFIYDIVKPVKPSNDLTMREKMLLAGTVGGIAAFVTSPLELISIRQSLDTQIPKAWRRNYGSPQSALEAVKKSPGLWHGASINVLRHVLLNISLTAPYDWLHQRLWIIFGDYGHVQPISLAFAALVASIVTLPIDNLRTKWMQRHSDPARNRLNAPTIMQYAALAYKVEGHVYSPWVGFYTYYTYMLIYSALTVGITDSVTSAIKRRSKLGELANLIMVANRLIVLQHISMDEKSLHNMIRHIDQTKARNRNLKALHDAVQTNLNSMRRLSKGATQNQENPKTLSIVNLKKQLKKIELDNDKLIQRLNEATAQNNKLKQTVNGARNERIIHSGIFKNIQKQTRFHQTTYKQLLIERRADMYNAEKMEVYYTNLKRITQNRIEKIKLAKEELNGVNTSKRVNNMTDSKVSQKPRTVLMKKKQQEKRDANKECSILKQQGIRYEQIIQSLRDTLGLKDILALEKETQDIVYETDQLYNTNCELNIEIQKLDENLTKILKVKNSREICKDTVHDQSVINHNQEHTANLRKLIQFQANEIGRLNSKLQQIANEMNIGQIDEDELCNKIEQKLSSNNKNNVAEQLRISEQESSDHISCEAYSEENKLSLLLNKSKQMKEVDQILSATQFKNVFREIQNKPTIQLIQ